MSAQSATRRVWTTRLASSPPLSTVRLGPGTRRVAHPRMPANEPARGGGAPTRVRSPRSPPRRPPPPPRRSSSSTGSSTAPRRHTRSAPSTPTRTRATGRTRTRRRRPKANKTRRVTRPRMPVGRSARRVCRARNPGVRRRSRGWTKRRAPTRFAKPNAEKRSALCLSSPSSGTCCCAASRSKRTKCSAIGCTGCPPRRRRRRGRARGAKTQTKTVRRQRRFSRGARFRFRSFLSRRLRLGVVPPEG